MSDRGLYRGIYSAMVDDAQQFQSLSKDSRLLLLVLRVCRDAGVACIFRYYPDVLRAQTGLTARELARAFRELETQPTVERPWISRDAEACVVWIRNGLRYDPMIKLTNPRHFASVRRALAALPPTSLLASFCRYYRITKAMGKAMAEAMAKPMGIDRRSDARASDSDSEKEKETTPPPTSPAAEMGAARPSDQAGPGVLSHPGRNGPDGPDGEQHRQCSACGHQWLGGSRCPRMAEHEALRARRTETPVAARLGEVLGELGLRPPAPVQPSAQPGEAP